MENTKKLGEIFFNGEIINLKEASKEQLEKKLEDINFEQSKIKETLFSMIECF